MICRVVERARKAEGIAEVLVATDDERIASRVEEIGARVIMTSKDHVSGTDRIAEAADNIEADLIVNVQGDEPLLHPEMIEEAVSPFYEAPDLQMSTLKTPINNKQEYSNPNQVKIVTDKDDFALYFSRATIPLLRGGALETLPDGVFGHVGLYVYRRDFLLKIASLPPTPLERIEKLEQLRVLENGYRIKAVTTLHSSIGVDTPEDLLRAEELLDQMQEK